MSGTDSAGQGSAGQGITWQSIGAPMAAIDEFLSCMPHTVTIEPFAGQDEYGDPAFGPLVSFQARVVGRVQLVRTLEGEEKVSTKTVYLGAAPFLSVRDKITLPIENVPVSPPILAVANFPDELGAHHTVVFLG